MYIPTMLTACIKRLIPAMTTNAVMMYSRFWSAMSFLHALRSNMAVRCCAYRVPIRSLPYDAGLFDSVDCRPDPPHPGEFVGGHRSAVESPHDSLELIEV